MLPPNFNELPSPSGDESRVENNTNNDFETIIKSDTSIDNTLQNETKSNSVAETVLNKIKKNDVD